eukprot:gene27357-36121_t
MTERLKEIVEEAVNKKKGPTTPGKGDAVFLLRFNGNFTGSCFAIDETHILSARHKHESPPGGSISDLDDLIVLERTDGGKFLLAISVKPTKLKTLPTIIFVELFRIASLVQKMENENSKCNDVALISKGGPYVDNVFGNAIGFHLAVVLHRT